jgi:hypothetical protein
MLFRQEYQPFGLVFSFKPNGRRQVQSAIIDAMSTTIHNPDERRIAHVFELMESAFGSG